MPISLHVLRDLINRCKKYVPPVPKDIAAKNFSGRLLEETVEFHLASGGSAQSAMAHVMDAIANEAFKAKMKNGSGGSNQASYPSKLEFEYDRDDIVIESADLFILFFTNLHISKIPLEDLSDSVYAKLEKLDKATEEGRLIMTPNGTFYIKK